MRNFIYFLLIIAAIVTASTTAFAQNQGCTTTELPCSCKDAQKIFELSLNNDPYLIERVDFEKANIAINSECKASLDAAMELLGVPIDKVFKKSIVMSRYTTDAFLRFMTNYFLQKKLKSFPINADTICITRGASKAKATKNAKAKIETLPKPKDIDGIKRIDYSEIKDPSCLIYLPSPFISSTEKGYDFDPFSNSFIVGTLIRSKEATRLRLAKDILNNFFYEIKNFGYVIGGNQGFKVTRSKNNIIVSNIWDYFNATKDYNWLEKTALENAVKIIDYWETRIGVIALGYENDEESKTYEGDRWFSHGIGPRPEEWKAGETYKPYYFEKLYQLVQIALTTDPKREKLFKGFDYNRIIDVANESELNLWKEKNKLTPIKVTSKTKELEGHTYIVDNEPVLELSDDFFFFTPTFFANERAANVAAYENHLYGPWNLFIDQFVDVGLNLEMLKAKKDISKMYNALAKFYEKKDSKLAKDYRKKKERYEADADEHKEMIMTYLRNKNDGMLFVYDSYTDTPREYPFTDAGYALWAGLFDINKDAEVKMLFKLIEYLNTHLESEHGYFASSIETGLSWDKPYIQAIHQDLIVHGLKRYASQLKKKGDKESAAKIEYIAERIAIKFLYGAYRAWFFQDNINLNDNMTAAAIGDLFDALSDQGKAVFSLFPQGGGR